MTNCPLRLIRQKLVIELTYLGIYLMLCVRGRKSKKHDVFSLIPIFFVLLQLESLKTFLLGINNNIILSYCVFHISV